MSLARRTRARQREIRAFLAELRDLQQAESLEEATRLADKGVRQFDSDPEVLAAAARVFLAAGQTDRAAELVEIAARGQLSDFEQRPSQQLAVTAYKCELYEVAIALARHAVDLDESDDRSANLLCRSLRNAGETEAALEVALSLEPSEQTEKLLSQLVQRALADNHGPNLLRSRRKILDRCEPGGDGRDALVVALIDAGLWREATELLRSQIAARSDDELNTRLLRRALRAAGSHVEATDLCRLVLALPMASAQLAVPALDHLARVDLWDDVARHAEAALKRDPTNPQLYSLLARASQRQRNLAEAAAAWRCCAELDPRDGTAWLNLLRLDMLFRDDEATEKDLEAARVALRTTPDGALTLAEIAAGIEHYEAMEAELKHVRCGGPTVEALLRCAALYSEHGFASRELTVMRAICEAEPANESAQERRRALESLMPLLGSELGPSSDDVLLPEALFGWVAGKSLPSRQSLVAAEAGESRKLVLVTGTLGPGGAERQVVNTIRGLSVRAQEISSIVLACRNVSDETASADFYLPELRGLEIPIVEIDRGNLDGDDDVGRRLGNDIATLLDFLPATVRRTVMRLYVLFCRERPAIVHAWQDSLNLAAGLAAVLANVPQVLLSARNVPPNEPDRFRPGQRWFRDAYRALLQCPGVALLHNSGVGADLYSEWLGVPRDSMAVVHNGIDFGSYRKANDAAIPPDLHRSLEAGPVVGSAFKFLPKKDPLLWLRTAALVAQQEPRCKFLILGDGPMREQMQELAERLGIARQLFMPGVVSDIGAYYRKMSLFFLSSSIEGLPNVLIEALGCGVPAVSTRAGGTSEVIEHGITGWIVDEREPEALAERILYCLSDRKWRVDAASNACLRAQQKFSVEAMIERTRTVYRELARVVSPDAL